MLLYHINLGFPFVSPALRLYIPTRNIRARDEHSLSQLSFYDRMEEPRANEAEYVFSHELNTDAAGNTRVLAVNNELCLGLRLDFNTKYLPYFMEWKSCASGDYVIGLEPANSCMYGRAWHEQEGKLHRILPFSKEKNQLVFTILDGREAIHAAVQEFKQEFGQ